MLNNVGRKPHEANKTDRMMLADKIKQHLERWRDRTGNCFPCPGRRKSCIRYPKTTHFLLMIPPQSHKTGGVSGTAEDPSVQLKRMMSWVCSCSTLGSSSIGSRRAKICGLCVTLRPSHVH